MKFLKTFEKICREKNLEVMFTTAFQRVFGVGASLGSGMPHGTGVAQNALVLH